MIQIWFNAIFKIDAHYYAHNHMNIGDETATFGLTLTVRLARALRISNVFESNMQLVQIQSFSVKLSDSSVVPSLMISKLN